jgi:hypothetical protein
LISFRGGGGIKIRWQTDGRLEYNRLMAEFS